MFKIINITKFKNKPTTLFSNQFSSPHYLLPSHMNYPFDAQNSSSENSKSIIFVIQTNSCSHNRPCSTPLTPPTPILPTVMKHKRFSTTWKMSCQIHFWWTKWKSSLLPNNHKKTPLFSINITNRYQFLEWKIKSDSHLYPMQTNLVISQGPNQWEPIIKPTSKKPKYPSQAIMWSIGKNPTTV